MMDVGVQAPVLKRQQKLPAVADAKTYFNVTQPQKGSVNSCIAPCTFWALLIVWMSGKNLCRKVYKNYYSSLGNFPRVL